MRAEAGASVPRPPLGEVRVDQEFCDHAVLSVTQLVGEGLLQLRRDPAVLRCSDSDDSHVPPEGLEPSRLAAPGLESGVSTKFHQRGLSPPNVVGAWLGGQGSNLRPRGPKPRRDASRSSEGWSRVEASNLADGTRAGPYPAWCTRRDSNAQHPRCERGPSPFRARVHGTPYRIRTDALRLERPGS